MTNGMTLQDELDRLKVRDERMLKLVMLSLTSAINVTVLAILPFWALYNALLEDYPFISRLELFGLLVPIFCGVCFGMVVMTALTGWVIATSRIHDTTE